MFVFVCYLVVPNQNGWMRFADRHSAWVFQFVYSAFCNSRCVQYQAPLLAVILHHLWAKLEPETPRSCTNRILIMFCWILWVGSDCLVHCLFMFVYSIFHILMPLGKLFAKLGCLAAVAAACLLAAPTIANWLSVPVAFNCSRVKQAWSFRCLRDGHMCLDTFEVLREIWLKTLSRVWILWSLHSSHFITGLNFARPIMLFLSW